MSDLTIVLIVQFLLPIIHAKISRCYISEFHTLGDSQSVRLIKFPSYILGYNHLNKHSVCLMIAKQNSLEGLCQQDTACNVHSYYKVQIMHCT